MEVYIGQLLKALDIKPQGKKYAWDFTKKWKGGKEMKSTFSNGTLFEQNL